MVLSPKMNKIIATNKVVMLASIIVPIEAVLPFLYASLSSFLTLNSSRILVKLITLASTAIPIPSNIAAIPGNVKTPPINQKIKNVKNVYNIIPNDAINPANRYITTINNMIHPIPIIPAINVFCSEFSPKLASTVLEEISVNLVGNFLN